MSASSVPNPPHGRVGVFDLGTQHPMDEGLGVVCRIGCTIVSFNRGCEAHCQCLGGLIDLDLLVGVLCVLPGF